MKLNKKIITISALALTVVTSLAGSITGTLAWYQYSTRSNALYLGASGGTNGNLQMKIRDYSDWLTRLTEKNIADYLNSVQHGDDMIPITSGNLDKEGALPTELYRNPIPDHASYDTWEKADEHNYVTLPLQLRFTEDGGNSESGKEKEVYLSKLDIKQAVGDSIDLSPAIRFHVSTYLKESPTSVKNFLVSKNGGKIDTHGSIDVNGDGKIDAIKPTDSQYNFDGVDLDPIDYGGGEQSCFAARVDADATNDIYPILAGSSEDSLVLDDISYIEQGITKSKSIGSTSSNMENILNVDITIWIEGWQKFDNNAIWSLDYINQSFSVDFEFAVN